MSNEIKVAYKEIEITYWENDNVWKFELRGRERSAESLAMAKGAIDKPAPEKKVPFKRIKAYLWKYGECPELIEVTSLAEQRYSGLDVWVSSSRGRHKESVASLCAFTPANEVRVAEYAKRIVDIKHLEKLNKDLVSGMDKLDLSGCE